jgi:hypothetical protein
MIAEILSTMFSLLANNGWQGEFIAMWLFGLFFFGTWKVIEIIAWLVQNTGVHTPMLE